MARRRDRRAKKPVHVVLAEEQRQALDLIADRQLGEPSHSALIRRALDDFIEAQVKKDPTLAEDLARLRARGTKVVSIRPLKREE